MEERSGQKHAEPVDNRKKAIWIGAGLAIGVVLGLAIDNLAIGIAVGLLAGAAIGFARGRRS